jgi:calcineurin-like phosphoesterase family protein
MNPDNIFFTADLHFGHRSVIRYCNRPHDSADEMDAFIIKRWNEQVPKQGASVFLIGDVSMVSPKRTKAIIKQLNGTLFLVRGNHDRRLSRGFTDDYFAWDTDLHEMKVDGQDVVLCHYPIASWNKMAYGSWMLHGHCHGRYRKDHKKILDVGWDSAFQRLGRYRLFTWEDVTGELQ